MQAVQDIAELTVVLSVEGKTPKGAAAGVRALQTDLDAAVDASDVVLDDRAVSGLTLTPVHVPIDSRGIRTRLSGYEAALTITLRTSDFDALPELMELAAASGATQIYSTLRVSDRPALKKQARELAAKAAQAKAESMTRLLGVELGTLRQIDEGDLGQFDNNFTMNVQNEVRRQPDGTSHGQTEGVTVTVTLTYELG